MDEPGKRKVRAVKLLLLYTDQNDTHSYRLVPKDAIEAIRNARHITQGELYRIEVELDFGNDLQLSGKFENREEAVAFIEGRFSFES